MSWWEHAYRAGHVNWDPGQYDGHLPWLIDTFSIRPCRAIDIGCGNGKSAIWLAEQGFDVTGVDLAPTAIKQAVALAARRNVPARFVQGVFPNVPELLGIKYDLVIERGFLQHLKHEEMAETLLRISELLSPGGFFYSLMLADGGKTGYRGMKRWREDEIRAVVQPLFRVVSMKKSVFTPGETGSMPAWVTVMKTAGR